MADLAVRPIEPQPQARRERLLIECDGPGAVGDDQIGRDVAIAVRDRFHRDHPLTLSYRRGQCWRESAPRCNPFRGDWSRLACCNTAMQIEQSPSPAAPAMLARRRVGWPSGRVWAMRSRVFRGNVFVANLPPELSDDALAEAFDTFGIVLSAHVARDPSTGERLRYGFVDIATERAAERAVAAMNGAALGGH